MAHMTHQTRWGLRAHWSPSFLKKERVMAIFITTPAHRLATGMAICREWSIGTRLARPSKVPERGWEAME